MMALHFTCSLGTIHDAVISKVNPDGSYHVQSRDGMCGMDVNDPSAVSLVDDDGNPFVPQMQAPVPTAEALQQQLLETQAALATMYETLAVMLSGGGM